MCRLLKVSPSVFWAWCRRPKSQRVREDQRLLVKVQASYADSRQTYGSRRVQRDLKAAGEAVGRQRVARLMRGAGLHARRRCPYRVTTNSKHRHPIAANGLARDFKADGVNRKWAAGISYIKTCGGWLYLAVVLDLYSRCVVGWAMSRRITRELALSALRMALVQLGQPQQLLHHSDRGSQYASKDYQRFLEIIILSVR